MLYLIVFNRHLLKRQYIEYGYLELPRHNDLMEQTEFSAIVLPMQDKIFRFARSIVSDEEEAYDITQDIMERLWIRRATLEEYGNLEGFVMKSVRNLCLDKIRSRNRRLGKLDDLNSRLPRSATFESDGIDTMELIRNAMEKLPEQQKTAMHLRDIEEMEIDDISDIMRADSATVRVWISRARRTIREHMLKVMNYGV